VEFKTFKKEKLDEEKRIFEGYAATWDLDEGGDIIHQGAFSKTINERGNRIKVLWQHYEAIGKPIEMREDEKGLYVKAQISDTQLGRDAMQLLKDGVIDTMSIGYCVPEGKSDIIEGIRHIKEIKLYEFSVVTFPMNEKAIITNVKNHLGLLERANPELFKRLETLIDNFEPHKSTQKEDKPLGAETLKRLNNLIQG
jgi:HK97 family phage prohead protease